MSILSEAIERDGVVEVRHLIKDGIDLNTPVLIGEEYDLDDYDEISPLFYAIRKYASLDMIELFLENGVDIYQTDSDGVSALDMAIKFKRIDVIEFCIEKKFDLNTTKRKSGITPVMLASCFSNIEMMALLLDNGAEINISDRTGMSPKDYAKKLGQKKMIEYLDSRGAKHNIYDNE